VAAIIECSTESKAKTMMEVRTILTKHQGSQSPVQFLFKRRGVILLKSPLPENVSLDLIMECALEVDGFADIEEEAEDGSVVKLISEPSATKAVADAVEKLGLEAESLEISWQPIGLVEALPDEVVLIEAAVEKIEDINEVQNVYLNMRRGDGAEASAT
jgi:transcriptional/translational regulatory protein YebC/TACO1